MKIFSGNSNIELATSICSSIGVPLGKCTVSAFPNGETYVKIDENVRGEDVYIVQSTCPPTNHHLMELFIMMDAVRRASAARITPVLPYYGYARQDKKHRGREPISARLLADLFKAAGASRIMTVDLHTSQIQGFFDGPVDHLFALPLLSEHIASRVDRREITVVSPDAGRVRVAERWTDVLGAPLAIIHKRRDPDVPNQVTMLEVVGDVEGRVCVVVDDMIDTGGTIAKAAQTLMDFGAKDVIVAATHGILSKPAAERLRDAPISEVVVTNTLPIPEDQRFDKLTILSIAPILARAVYEVFTDGSVTRMFEGEHESST